MWEKFRKFTNSYTILSAFLIGIFYISVLSLITYTIIERPQNGLPPGAITLVPFTVLQIVLTTAAIFLMRKLEIFQKSDYGIKNLGKGLILAWVGIVVIIGRFILEYLKYPENSFIIPNIFYILLIFFHLLIGTALFEETLYRGLILKILLKKAGHTKKGIIISCVVSSIVFGVLHICNYPLIGISVIPQIFGAFAFGLFCAALYLRTDTLLIPILIHGFWNIATQIFYAIISPDFFIQIVEVKSQLKMKDFFSVESILVLIVGFILLWKVTPENLLTKYDVKKKQ